VISSLTALFIIFAAVIGSASMVGIIAYFMHRMRQLEAGTTGEAGSHQLVDEVSGMREELVTVQEEMSALSERLDFTEKLLMRGDDSAAPGGSA
jgi:Skp family chaperone for outer membrane proteins